jgi:hypothetical protein
MTAAKNVTKKEENAGSLVDLDFGAGSARGNENIGVDDLTIPRIGIIQALSSERKKNDPAYIDGAEEGDLFNTVTRKLYKEPILVVPVYYRLEYLLWKIRKEGGGFRGVFNSYDEAMAEGRTLKETTEIQDTAQQFVLTSDDGGKTWTEAVVSMARSNRSVAKTWNSDIRLRSETSDGKTYDRFVHVYELKAAGKSNADGDFFVFQVTWKRFVDRPLFERAEKVYEAIAKGQRDVSRDYEPESGKDSEEMGDF